MKRNIDSSNTAPSQIHTEDSNFDKYEALKNAIIVGRLPMVKYIVSEYNIDLNHESIKYYNNTYTPLQFSVYVNNLPAVKFLIENCKASLDNLTKKNGWDILQMATMQGDLLMIDYLVSQGMDPEVKTIEGESLLHLAIKQENTPNPYLLPYLIHEYALTVNTYNSKGYTPLHVAIANKKEAAVITLLENKADAKLTTDEDFNSLTLAELQGNERIIDLIVEALGIDNTLRDAYPIVSGSG
jgi:ankyrin repeat protein